jgi:hypothetical protein
MSSLYKDAIADARKLREVAEQNAKNRIIEAVTPKLRRLIERQITEGDELLDDDLSGDLVDTEEAMDMLDDEQESEMPEAIPMNISSSPPGIDSDGLGSMEIVDDEADLESIDDGDLDLEEESSEETNKSVHVNITVEGKMNHLLRHRAVRLVKALSEAKSSAERNKLHKELELLRKALIITENGQNKRLAYNLSVILKESTMRRRRNSWLFEGKDGAAGEEVEFDDAGFDEGGDTIEVDAAALESALGLEAGTISGGVAGGDDEDLDMDDDMAMDDDLDLDDEEGDDMDLDMEDDLGDEMYEMMGEADEFNVSEDDECSEDDEIVEVNEAMLRRALGASRRAPARRSSRLSETRRRMIARRRMLREGEAKSMASSFGGGKLGKEMFVDVDEDTLLNALAEELGSYSNSTKNQGSASKMAGHFGGGSIKKGAVMEARAHRRTKQALSETRRVAARNARAANAAKAELKESNLFNAKLLFVTKLLQQHSLNSKQQRAIVEAMDNAKTQREAKLLFTSLNESLNKRASQKLQESRQRQTLNESRTTYSNRSLQSGQATQSNAVELDRWAVLAGIKK